MEENETYITTLNQFVRSVMLQLTPFLAEGSKVRFRVPIACMATYKMRTCPEFIARVYNQHWVYKDTPPTYIEFDTVFSHSPKPLNGS